MKKLLIQLVCVFLMTACVKETDFPLPGNPINLIVVNAIITDELKIHTIGITHPNTMLNEIPQPVTGLTILVTTSDFACQFTENPAGSGIYQSDTAFVCQTGFTYTLTIFSSDQAYSAQASMVQGTTFPELRYAKNNTDSCYHIDWVASEFQAEDPAMWEVFLDWSQVPGYEQEDPEACQAILLFYTLPSLDVSEIFAPEVEKISFPAGTIIDEKRYSLTPGHAEFIRTLLLETSWQGSLFPSASANVGTNLSDGALGYFGICSVTALSIIVTP